MLRSLFVRWRDFIATDNARCRRDEFALACRRRGHEHCGEGPLHALMSRLHANPFVDASRPALPCCLLWQESRCGLIRVTSPFFEQRNTAHRQLRRVGSAACNLYSGERRTHTGVSVRVVRLPATRNHELRTTTPVRAKSMRMSPGRSYHGSRARGLTRGHRCVR